MKRYRNSILMAVLAFGLAACGDDLTIVEPTPNPPPPAAPETPNIVTFSVAPTTATIAVGQSVQASYQLVTKPGVEGTVSYASSNTGVASVNATSGLITAVSEGNAVITATATADGQTATAQIGITVRTLTPAQVSIQKVTYSNTDTPVNIGNVAGQIEVTLNFDPGEQNVSEVAVYIGNKKAAWQTYASSPAAGPIVLSINTANYVKNATAGTTAVDYENGPTKINGRLTIVGQGEQNAQNEINIVLNNQDGWAADMTKPTRSANADVLINGWTFWGGPGLAGATTVTVYPVVYTPGRSAVEAHFTLPGCGAGWSDDALPFRATFGYGHADIDVNCAGYEWMGGDRDIPEVWASIDNENSPFPVTTVDGLIPNTVVLGSTPDSLRFDWASPNVSIPTVVGDEGQNWVKADWSFKPAGVLVVDNGVGADNASWRARVSSGAGVNDTVTVGGDLDETNTNIVAVDGYRLVGVAHDRLMNSNTSANSPEFGVDVTAPQIRYSVVAAPSSFASSYTRASSNTTADSTVYAAFSGIYGADAGAAASGDIIDYIGAAVGTNDSTRTDAIDNRSGLHRAVVSVNRFAQGGATGTNAAAPGGCSTSNGAYGVALIDGWRPSPAANLICDATTPNGAGYYTTAHSAVDRAGNRSTSIYKRTIAYDPGQPQVTGVSPNASYTGNAPAIFTIGAQDDLEVVDGSIRVRYPNVTLGDGSGTAAASFRWWYGNSPAFAARFDNSIVNPLIGTMTLDQFTVSIQDTETGEGFETYEGDPILPANVAVVKPDSVAATVRDVYGSFKNNFFPAAMTGVSAELASPLLSATIPAVGSYSVTYDGSANCPAGGVVGGACVIGGINFRGDNVAPLPAATERRFRAVQDMNTTLPIFTRVDLFGLNADGEWQFIQRITVPTSISPNATVTTSGGTIVGTDNTFERYWVYTFTNVPAGFTAYRALGVNAAGHGLFSTRH